MNCIIVSIYRIPGYLASNKFLNRLRYFFQHIEKQAKNKLIYIASDFNIDLLIDNRFSNEFKELSFQFGYFINNNSATRITHNTKTCIDNILTSAKTGSFLVHNVDLSLSDHAALLINLPEIRLNKQFKIKKRLYKKNTLPNFLTKLHTEMQSISFSDSVDTNYNAFLKSFVLTMDEFFPVRTMNKPVSKKVHWITPGIKISAQKKQYLHVLSKSSNDPLFLYYVKKYKKIFKRIVRKAKIMANDKYICSADNKSKATWSVVNRELCNQTKSKEQIVLNVNNVQITSPVKVAECFNDYFVNTVNFLNILKPIKNVTVSLSKPRLSDFEPMSNEELISLINSLNNNKSCGWDGIPIQLLKASATIIGPVLCKIFNSGMALGVFPERLKYSEVKPVFKAGSKKDQQNYRPISLLSNVSKIFEKALNNRLTDFLETNRLLCKEQFGFRKNKNTESALISFVSSIVGALDGSQLTSGVFCDLSKAFDCVDLENLLDKLYQIGIQGKALELLKSYLENRKQRTVIARDSLQFSSNWKNTRSGVPQGSILGPILFLIYINALPSQMPLLKFILFADDTNVIVSHYCKTQLKMLTDRTLIELNEWFISNGLFLNKEKTKIINFTAKNNVNDNMDTISTISHKFLGIIIDRNLNFKDHVQYLVKKLNTLRFAFNILYNTVSMQTRRTVYFSYVQSILKYGIVTWGMSPNFYKVFIAQKAIVRVIFGAGYRSSCRPLFRRLNILTLPCLYILEILIFVHNNLAIFENYKPKHYYNTRNKNVFNYPVHKLKILERSPLYMGIRLYNKLPEHWKSFGKTKFLKVVKNCLLIKTYYSIQEFIEDSL